MTELGKLRLVLAATFALQIGGMIAYWPADQPEPPPLTPQQNYDLNILYDPPTTTAPAPCQPIQVVLQQCEGIPVLR